MATIKEYVARDEERLEGCRNNIAAAEKYIEMVWGKAKLFDGFRLDSGDEYKVGDMIIDKLKSMRIDPTSKTIVFGNVLTFDKAADIVRYFNGRVKVSFVN